MEGMCVKFDVIGLDSPCVDLAVNVRCFPKPNGAERIQNLSWQGGGKVASGMVAAARLGLCCGIMGNVGDDKYGTFCLRDFQDHGIDTEQMCVRKNRTTNFDIVISDEGSMGRSFVFYPGNRETLTLGVVPNKRSFLSMVEAKRQKDCFMEEIRKIKASIVEIVDIDDIWLRWRK